MYGGIEAGGTKFVCAVGSGPTDIQAEVTFPTTTPEETLARAIDFFKKEGKGLTALGVASFGPVDLNPASPTYGSITTTPKPHWSNVPVVKTLQQALQVPVSFDTDVNGAALGEWRWGAAQGLDTFIYLTVGTGIGGGGMVGGNLMHGLVHPEMGHLLIRHDRQVDPFGGLCPYHGDCLEGLAAGPALAARWGQNGATLSPNHAAWPLEANYLAQAVVNFILTLSPQRIIMGGGVMGQLQLFPLVHFETKRLLNNYVQTSQILDRIGEYIVPPALGSYAGVLGAFVLAQQVVAAVE